MTICRTNVSSMRVYSWWGPSRNLASSIPRGFITRTKDLRKNWRKSISTAWIRQHASAISSARPKRIQAWPRMDGGFSWEARRIQLAYFKRFRRTIQTSKPILLRMDYAPLFFLFPRRSWHRWVFLSALLSPA